jgi:phospholipase C
VRALRFLAGALMVVAPCCALVSPAHGVPAVTSKSPTTATPIKHFVSLMQENHSFDNYFGTYRGANGIPAGTCIPRRVDDPSKGCVKPYRLGNRAVQDLGHNTRVFAEQYNHGAMNGFVSTYTKDGIDGSLSMGHYDDHDIPYYWNIADQYVLFDKFFTSAAGGSVRNHMYWVTADPGNRRDDAIPAAGFDVPTIFDRLEAKGVSWKFYIQNYDPTINLYHKGNGDHGAQVVWAPLLDFPRYLHNPQLMKHIVPLEQYFHDLDQGTLPAVSYVVPSGASEHPPGSIQAGEAFVRTLINSLMRSTAWDSSAFMWSYDDWGGWYDHVSPPRVDQFGLGFRVPALLLSPYAKRGYIDGTVEEFSSILAFIEHNWGLKPLTSRDAKASDLFDAFQFEKPPRPPAFLTQDRRPTNPPPPKRAVVYGSYSLAIGLPLTIIVVAWFGAVRVRRRGVRK